MVDMFTFKCSECGVSFYVYAIGEGYTTAKLESSEGAKALPVYCRNDHKNMVYWTKE
ncbi:MAG: hypothetical protein ACE5EW_06710 [Thermoplasmata archaeon]